jgi:serine/threonine-protein kinase
MASVYKAYEPGLDRSVAVKVLPAEFLHEPTFAERFRREAQVVAKLEHPNIIPIYAYGIDDGLPWMSMRLIGGGALHGILRQSGRLKPARLLHFVRSVAEALDYAHAAGVVHRDVKPQNILVDERDHVYLADFGLAKMVEGAPGLTQTGMITGTPEYMAPEQAMGGAIDRRVDIYSLGVVAYACITGRVPFTADTPLAVLMKHVRDPIPLPPVEEVPEPVMRVLLKALAKAPGERWPTAGAFVDALARSSDVPTLQMPTVTAAPRVVAPPPLPPRGPTPPARSRDAGGMGQPRVRQGAPKGLLLAAIAALLVVGGAALVAVLSALRPAVSPDAPPVAVTREEPAIRPVASGAAGTPTPQAVTPEAPPARGRTPSPAPPSATLPSVPATRPPSERPRPSTDRTKPPAAEAAQATASEAPVPPPTPLPTAPGPPERASSIPAGTPFAIGSRIALGGMRQSLVRLDTVLFKVDKGRSELQAEVRGHCDEGKDHAVEIQLELLDASGQTVAWVKGKGGIEEGDDGTVKAKQKLPAEQLARLSAFRLTLKAWPD